MTATVHAEVKDLEWVRIARAVNYRVQSGREFTTDEIWYRLTDIRPADHQARLGQMIQQLSNTGRIREVGGRKTERGRRHSRYVPVWEGVPQDERIPA